MHVRLISTTIADGMTGDELIAFCARVSSPHRQEDHDSAPRLLRYLIAHKHWSPFEMADMTVEIETSRAIAAQILRHRSFSFQEFSQRYAVASLGFETCEARRQDTKNRQSSHDDLDGDALAFWRRAQAETQRGCQYWYDEAIRLGIAREQARMLLPLSTRTRLYMKGSIRSWLHYFEVRCAPETQKEHRDVACAAREVFEQAFPMVAAAARGEG